MSPWPFYGFGILAFTTAGFFVVQAAVGATNTTHTLGVGVFAFLALLAIAVGNALRSANSRLRDLERRQLTSKVGPGDALTG